ncbi:MAG: hypothetical protein LBU34_02110 [Planctomycetaceae bacterium]|jgi:predicted metal-dependent phosphoesterase TrpH|nr:hypothetical protein [Planctomycetaceae bacterium]
MSSRRDFLKCSALLGAATTTFATNIVSKGDTLITNQKKTYTVNMKPCVVPLPLSPREIIIPNVEGFKVLKGDFHLHTLFSDGQVMPSDRIIEAVDNGLDIIAITDHIEYRPFFSKKGRYKLNNELAENFNIWYDTAKPEAEKHHFLLVRGAEITKELPLGHFNVLFANDINPIAAAVNDWRKMLKIAADQGAFLLWNHPGYEIPADKPLQFTELHEEAYQQGLLHGIEIFNGWDYYPIVSDWCNERNLALFANSDIHPSELRCYGIKNMFRPITLVLAKEQTVESTKEAFFARRTIAWAANILWGRDPWLPALFKASVNIKFSSSGTLELTNTSSLPISVTIGGVAFNLPKDVKCQVYRAEGVKTLTVTNWMVATNKPLEIPLS